MNNTRLIIFAKELHLVTGYSLRHAQRILQKARQKYNKKKGHLVTVAECAAIIGLRAEEILEDLKNKGIR